MKFFWGASVHAVENAQDNYDKKICLFSQKELEQENPGKEDIYPVFHF